MLRVTWYNYILYEYTSNRNIFIISLVRFSLKNTSITRSFWLSICRMLSNVVKFILKIFIILKSTKSISLIIKTYHLKYLQSGSLSWIIQLWGFESRVSGLVSGGSASSSALGMSNTSAKSAGSASRRQCARGHQSNSWCRRPSARADRAAAANASARFAHPRRACATNTAAHQTHSTHVTVSPTLLLQKEHLFY